jgi:hypothetical protein
VLRPIPSLAVAALLAALVAPAVAGPSVFNVAPPGGFATACGSDLSSSNAFLPGVDVSTLGTFNPGHFTCQSQIFAGSADTGQAAAQWTAPNVTNSASSTAGMGIVQLQARNTAPANVQFPAGVGTGGWSETMTITAPGLAGQAAVWTFAVGVQGTLNTDSPNLARLFASVFKNQGELPNNVPGFTLGGSDVFGTDRQRVRWDAATGADRTINSVVTFAVPVTLGQSFNWGVYAALSAGMGAWSPSLPTVGTTTAQVQLRYGGSTGLTVGGAAVADYTLNAASGLDWQAATPVPEPRSAALLLAGVAMLGSLTRRRWG